MAPGAQIIAQDRPGTQAAPTPVTPTLIPAKLEQIDA